MDSTLRSASGDTLERQLTASHSNGHGCMLQYALLHLFGYALSIDDLKNFRVSRNESSGAGLY